MKKEAMFGKFGKVLRAAVCTVMIAGCCIAVGAGVLSEEAYAAEPTVIDKVEFTLTGYEYNGLIKEAKLDVGVDYNDKIEIRDVEGWKYKNNMGMWTPIDNDAAIFDGRQYAYGFYFKCKEGYVLGESLQKEAEESQDDVDGEIEGISLNDDLEYEEYFSDAGDGVYRYFVWPKVLDCPNGEHVFGEWVIGSSYHVRYCSFCNYMDRQAHAKYNEYIVVEPTCTEGGYSYLHCKKCGYTQGKKAGEAHLRKDLTEPLDHKKVTKDAKAATCAEAGYTGDIVCERCGELFEKGTVIPAHGGHKYSTDWKSDDTNHWHECSQCKGKKDNAGHTLQVVSTTKATLTQNGKIVKKCSVCNKTVETAIPAPKTLELSETEYEYNGKVKKPSVVVKDADGDAISSKNYSVKYAKGRKDVGKYTVTVTFKGDYSGSKKLTFKINPPKTSLKSVKAKSKGCTVKWAKKTKQVTGYEVQYSTASDFSKGNKTVKVTSNKTVTKAINKLKAKKKYYVRVRTYKTVGKTKFYSEWSNAKNVTIKK